MLHRFLSLHFLVRPRFVSKNRLPFIIMHRNQHVSFKLNDDHVDSPADVPQAIETSSNASDTSSSPSRKRVSVAIVVIGDEILKGQVDDSNSNYLCQRLNAVGAEVRKISVIPDKMDAISNEIKQLNSKVRWIITAGGVGPTHDDVTYEGIANAFKVPLEKNETLLSLIRHHLNKSQDVDLSLAEQKLATVPVGSSIMMGDIRNGENASAESISGLVQRGIFPVVRIQNVLILPGIPVLLRRAFNSVRHLFESDDGAIPTRCVYIKLDELSFADTLTEVAAAHKSTVVIGSYPDVANNYYRVKVIFESSVATALNAAVNDFTAKLPADSFILDSDMPGDIVAEAEERVYKFSHRHQPLCAKVSAAVSLTENILRQHGHDNIAICFTGGKDCTAVLHILYAALKRVYKNKPSHLLALQLSTFEPFVEVEQFIDETKRRYGFQFVSYIGTGMKEALTKFGDDYPHIKVVFMGTRQNDPSASKLLHIQKTDPGWPELLRVSPILDWSYNDVWSFIRHLHLPYCSLYDRGFTSLGNPSTTHPNRMLLSRSAATSLLRYLPAYELRDESAERAGRDTQLPNVK